MSVLHVVRGGVLTSVQDRGRAGMAHWGVPRGGALDHFALGAANRVLGNQSDAAVLEITAGGAQFELLQSILIAIAGADLDARLDDLPLPLWTAVWARRGSIVSMGQRSAAWGARAYLAVAGGWDVPLVLGSRSTCFAGGFGGVDGRAVRANDRLAAGVPQADPTAYAGCVWPAMDRPAYGPTPVLRFLAGPHQWAFESNAIDRVQAQPYVIDPRSNRMGFRLHGQPLAYAAPIELPSLGVLPGVIQVPPDGAPILLMADAQPTGGYPIVGVVIEADLPLAAQLLPGDSLQFQEVTLADALAARSTMHGWLAAEIDGDPALPLLGWAGA